MFPEEIETPSLVLERVHADRVDTFELYDLFREGGEAAEGVFEFVPQEPHATVADARDWIDDAERKWEEGETAQYAVRPAGDPDGDPGDHPDDAGDLAGFTALAVDWESRTGHLGAILARPYWGRGYAGECARAMADLAFERLDLPTVEIGYEEGNERSAGAVEPFVESLGGEYEGLLRNVAPVGDEILPHHRYTITREEYREATDP